MNSGQESLLNKNQIQSEHTMEFSVGQRQSISDRGGTKVQLELKSNTSDFNEFSKDLTQYITTVAKMQIFDISADYDVLLEQPNVPTQLYPKQISAFKTYDYKKSSVQRFIEKIPVYNPDNIWMVCWRLFNVLIIFFYLFYIPLKVFFTDTASCNPTKTQATYLFINEEYCDPNMIPSIHFLVIFTLIPLFLDMILQFNVGFYRKGTMELDRGKIAFNYFQWKFELDVIAYLSLIIALATNIDWIRYFFFVKIYYLFQFDDQINQILQLKRIWKAMYQLLKLFLILIFVTHMFACFFYGVAYNQVIQGNSNSWLLESGYTTHMPGDQHILGFGLWERYGVSLYWSLTTISTVGYGDITPKNSTETTIAFLTMLIAGMIFAFNVASIRETMLDMNQLKAKFTQQMICINRYMKHKDISEQTQVNNVLRFFQKKFLFMEESNRDHYMELQLINTLPPELREQLYSEAGRQFLNCTALCFQGYSVEFLKSLSLDIEEVHYGTSELIFQENHLDDDPNLYYVINGCVLLYRECSDRRFDDEIKLGVCRNMQVFNEFSFFTGNMPRTSSKCLQYTSLYKLKRSKFLSKLGNHQFDFEKYHILVSNQNSPQFYQRLGMKCYTCNEHTHSVLDCDVTHFVADKVDVINKRRFRYRSEETQQRKKGFSRVPRKKSINRWLAVRDLKLAVEDFVYFTLGTGRDSQARPTQHFKNRQSRASFDHYLEDLQENQGEVKQQTSESDLLREDIKEIKSLMIHICGSLGVQLPKLLQQVEEEQVIRPFIPEKPQFEPWEVSLEIDEIKSYEVYYPQFNFNVVMMSYLQPRTSQRPPSRLQTRRPTRR